MASMRGGSRNGTASSVGMMDGAFFVSRTELLQWVNGLLQISLTKVEQCASGAVYCQIIDACRPGSVAMKKVNWMAKSDHEFIPNYKVLQAAFDRNGIERHIDVDKLIRAKYQDNLEFLQWMKCHWDREFNAAGTYDPAQSREGKALPPWAQSSGIGSSPIVTTSQHRGATAVEKENRRPIDVESGKRAVATGAGKPVARMPRTAPLPGQKTPRSSNLSRDQSRTGTRASGDSEPRQVEVPQAPLPTESVEEESSMEETLGGLEKERDYYFRKLRDVEIFCTTLQANMNDEMTRERILEEVLGILYKDNDEDGEAKDPLADVNCTVGSSN